MLTVIVSSFFHEVKSPIVRSNLKVPRSPEFAYYLTSATVVKVAGAAAGAVNDY
jgi:hypothetical protein